MRSDVAGCAWAAKKGPASNDAKIRLLLSPSVIEAERRCRRASFVTLFPDSGPLGREFYQNHIKFFEAGATYKERLFMAVNRVGKTVAGAYEATCHLTGRYPHWWRGRRFEKPTDGWACGTNSQTTRDVVQGVLLDRTTGQGMIPAEAIRHTIAGRGIAGSIETVWV
jgi:Terminase large subunit, T4likevirus-type, N-terminal